MAQADFYIIQIHRARFFREPRVRGQGVVDGAVSSKLVAHFVAVHGDFCIWPASAKYPFSDSIQIRPCYSFDVPYLAPIADFGNVY